jgi:hypothetical protein
MTTRAGITGILTGLLSTLITYLFIIIRPAAYLLKWSADSVGHIWIAVVTLAILMIAGGFLAARRGGSGRPWRRAALGGLAGGLAGVLFFCLWGAAAAGLARWISPLDNLTNEPVSQVEVLKAIVWQTAWVFLVLFWGGSLLGTLGGWLSGLRQDDREEIFNKVDPQMAMNASITAVLASIASATLAAGIFSRLSGLHGNQTGQDVLTGSMITTPLLVSLLLVLFSHIALTAIIPHEAQQAEHRCGLDEVKMAAYIGIGAAPLLILLLLLVNPDSFTSPLVLAVMLASAIMSLITLSTLRKQIQPRRTFFLSTQNVRQKKEAKLFGTIANSPVSRLVVLCMGCGLAMALPLHVSVFSVLINLTYVLANSTYLQPVPQVTWRLFMTQALVSLGVIAASIGLLIIIYLIYLNLARQFNHAMQESETMRG